MILIHYIGCPFLGPLVPLFRFLATSPLGFKARVGSALFAFCGGKCNGHSPRSTSGATLGNLLLVSMHPVGGPCSSWCSGGGAGMGTRGGPR